MQEGGQAATVFDLALLQAMIKVAATIGGPVGLHARPAAEFVREAEKFDSEIRLVKDGMRVNGKSILAILTLAAERGCVVTLEIDGRDEQQAMEVLRVKLEKNDS